jgi:hypothetical protein
MFVCCLVVAKQRETTFLAPRKVDGINVEGWCLKFNSRAKKGEFPVEFPH